MVFCGLMSMACSANDCDGACMETANPIGEMLVVAGVGAAMMAIGALILIKNSQEA